MGSSEATTIPSRLLIVAFLVSLGGSFHFGFQLVVTNPTQSVFLKFVNDSHYEHYGSGFSKENLDLLWSAIVAVLFAGALVGSFIMRWLAEILGRRSGLIVAMALCQLAVCMAFTSYWIRAYELYVASRILLGVGVSITLGLGAMYLAEASPKSCRGKVGMITGSMVQVGTVAGSVIALPQLLGTARDWPLIYVAELGCLFLPFILMPFLPESPSFLVKRGHLEKARRAVQFFHGCSEESAEKVVEELKIEQQQSAKASIGMWTVMQRKELRKKTLVGMVVAFVMAFSGVAVINGYAVEILMNTGMSRLQASLANVGFNGLSLVAIFVSTLIVERFGRRPLLLSTSTAILITNLCMVAFMYAYTATKGAIFGYLLVALIAIFTFFFAAGPGPLCYFISAELLGMHARSAAQGWTSVVQMGSRTLLLSIYLPLKNLTGNATAYMLLFVVPVIVSIIFLYFRLPETKNKTPLQVAEAATHLPRLSNICGRQPKIIDVEEGSDASSTSSSH